MPFNRVFQVEILDPLLELVQRSDVTAHLSIAVEQLREHFVLERISVRVEVRHDRRGEFEGMGFYDRETGDLRAHITAFYLDRETVDHIPPEVTVSLEAPRSRLEASLQDIFKYSA